MRRRLAPQGSADVATSLGSVAFCLQGLGRAADALPLYQESVALRERLKLPEDDQFAIGLFNLARCLHVLGASHEALPHIERANSLAEELFPDDHPFRQACAGMRGKIRANIDGNSPAEK